MTKVKNENSTLPGYPWPLGATLDTNGCQFAIFSRHADRITLILFESTDPYCSFREIEFDSEMNKTGDIWHIWIEGVKEGQLYGYRVDGPYTPEHGHRFNRNKLLLDPYARAVTGNFDWNLADARGFDTIRGQITDTSFSTKDSAPGAPKCIVIDHSFDWFDRPVKRPLKDSVIYEMHVKGFTMHQSSGIENKGTYKGIVEKIPYLKELGITAIELLPIQEFDSRENLNKNPFTGEQLSNYWGYSTMSFFAPKSMYSASGRSGEQYYEFKEMIRDLHSAGIEVILDVVFNHTAEGDHTGPTMCFRGIDNKVYYILEEDRRFYKNYSGCGNTFNCNNPLVRDFIIDCLKYWVVEMHIDGFRFDLASILGRDENGNILSNPPLIERIEADPILQNTKIIAEAWDAAGAYQVGGFPGRWAEWNGKFRDDVRRFWNSDDNMSGTFATRITGSSDIYSGSNRSPLHSINFITCHDGFTMNDLTMYNTKHNEANGEGNRDGENHNHSCNFGIEGDEPTDFLRRSREKQIKNYLTTLFMSQGVPMLLSGDEIRKTQKGNNNAYCQDNEISWNNWELIEKNKSVFSFTKKLISFRKKHPILSQSKFLTGEKVNFNSYPDISWHGIKPDRPDWEPRSKLVACLLNGAATIRDTGFCDNDIYMAFNSSYYNLKLEIPAPVTGNYWCVFIDTSKNSPDDIYNEDEYEALAGSTYLLKRQSTLVLISRKTAE
ncbi:MAG: glycogen debranching protein GlgX [Spirochaetes bacterium]|nr:glycogen debranching protein GlgX [Spirochaetota bacterium]